MSATWMTPPCRAAAAAVANVSLWQSRPVTSSRAWTWTSPMPAKTRQPSLKTWSGLPRPSPTATITPPSITTCPCRTPSTSASMPSTMVLMTPILCTPRRGSPPACQPLRDGAAHQEDQDPGPQGQDQRRDQPGDAQGVALLPLQPVEDQHRGRRLQRAGHQRVGEVADAREQGDDEEEEGLDGELAVA